MSDFSGKMDYYWYTTQTYFNKCQINELNKEYTKKV